MYKHLRSTALFTLRIAAMTAIGSALLGGLAVGFDNQTVMKLLPEIIYLIISVSVIAVAAHQVLVYQSELPCMSGMMIGMTTGMLSGFLIGYLIGATNGMFVGSVVGVLVGAGMGALTGRCCGLMGVIEGLMAGLMAGTMGAMLAVMLLVDQYRLFTAFFVTVCVVIFGVLSVMVEREFTALGKPAAASLIRTNERILALSTVVFTTLMIIVMVYAPRGPLTIFRLL